MIVVSEHLLVEGRKGCYWLSNFNEVAVYISQCIPIAASDVHPRHSV